MAEGQLKYTALDLPGTIKFGAWTHLRTFDDLRFGNTGVPLAKVACKDARARSAKS